VAGWLFLIGLMVVIMILIGGATRLTESGLSITQWKPISGTLPPMSQQDWQAEFEHYKLIPQYKLMNADMTLDKFKSIYWWEWLHRLFGRLIGVVVFLPLVVFLLRSEIPKRLIWRTIALLGLGGIQGGLGWWMVSSGLANRTDVAPERLMVHLGMGLIILVFAIWTGLEAAEGQGRGRYVSFRWRFFSGLWLALVFVQCLLGALVAGNNAGLIYNDFPLMNGYFIPDIDWSKGVGHALLHDQGMVQLLHRLSAYVLMVYTIIFGIVFTLKCRDDGFKGFVKTIAALVFVQAALGIATLISVVPLGLALGHQLLAVILVILMTILCWRVFRADRVFR
jgi:cytochrome c oxidase assembly protein subunit 15